MEMLVLKNDHWMDRPEKAERVIQLKNNVIGFYEKWDKRYQKGDVIDVKPDGYYSHPQNGKKYRIDKFILIRCPGIDLIDLDAPLFAGDGTIHKKRKYSVDVSGLRTGAILSEYQLNNRKIPKQIEVVFR